jgi:chorismate dehydratase
MSAPLRLGSVPYLNARPLVAGLDSLPGVALIEAPPSELARQLRGGRLDAALASAVELLREPPLGWIAGPAIASRGPVCSILLFLRGEPAAVRTLSLDRSSLTAAALAQVCLAEFLGVEAPRVTLCNPGAALAEIDADAVLRIGDPALTTAPDGRQALDLGALWTERTGLPFVWAVWLVRAQATAAELDVLRSAVLAARTRGLPQRDELARRFAAAQGLDPEFCRDYLHRRIHFDLGPDERQGLAAFARLAHRHGLVDHAQVPEPAA